MLFRLERFELKTFEPIVETSCEDAKARTIEPDAHSFIVKIWLEETAEEAGTARWRGHITHVPSGQRRYLKDLRDVCLFIIPYLEEMKVHLGFSWKVRQWLDRL